MMGELPNFFTPERWDGLWYYLKWVLFLGAPLVMIIIVLDNIELLIDVLQRFFKKAKKDNDDDDHDIYYY